MRICLVGHSLARNLGAYVQRDHPNFGLDDDILFIARGGLKVSDVVTCYDSIENFNPDLISLIIGENDLCEIKHWTLIGDAIMLAALHMSVHFPNARVVINRLLPRSLAGNSSYLYPLYNKDMLDTNQFLFEMCNNQPHIQFNDYRFEKEDWSAILWQTVFKPDGVHLQDRGLLKMYKGVKSGLIRSLKKVRR